MADNPVVVKQITMIVRRKKDHSDIQRNLPHISTMWVNFGKPKPRTDFGPWKGPQYINLTMDLLRDRTNIYVNQNILYRVDLI